MFRELRIRNCLNLEWHILNNVNNKLKFHKGIAKAAAEKTAVALMNCTEGRYFLMKPKIGTVFPQMNNEYAADTEIEKIRVSRMKRRMDVILNREINVNADTLDAIKRYYRLNNIKFVFNGDMPDSVENARLRMLREFEEESASVPQTNRIVRERPESLGRADITDMLYGRSIHDELVSISSISETSGRVVFRGQIFAIEFKEIKSKKGDEFKLAMFDVTDYQDSVTVKMFIKNLSDSQYEELKKKMTAGITKKSNKGIYVCVRGTAQLDEYMHEVVVMANAVGQVLPPDKPRMDNAPEKRVELHMHTQMSAMDGMNSAADLINRAIVWGHKAIAITDHGVVQSYPDGMKVSDNHEKIKVLYGVEGYLVDDSAKIVYKEGDKELNTSYVVFDIETTGLSKTENNITEIGAVKIENGKITDKWSSFVNPREPIPPNITQLTSITDDMVKDAPVIEDILGDFLEFCKGCVLVAHNAKFDVGFIEENAKRHGIPFDFCVLDTLQLGRSMYPELQNHKLNNLAKHLNVSLLHHHRAVDDAKATADIFVKMTEELKQRGIVGLKELNTVFDPRDAAKKTKAYHIILLAKNQIGLRHIYEMVSASHLKYFYRTPRIPKSLLKEKKEGIIIGAACEAGEFFRGILDGKSEAELEEIASLYDYLEIQPIGNNNFLKFDDYYPDIKTDDDLRDLNRRVVELGEKFNKPVAATCDVHFLDPLGANFRKILMHYKGFKDADNQAPLYLRTTEEMLAEFSYLGRDKAYEVVVKNTNMIADMIENVRPIPKEKCPPEIDGAKEGIKNDSERKAKEIYGDPLPEIVRERLDKELASIIGNGFAVMYRIAQELVRKSLSDGYLVGSRGSVGSSFVAFLSDITEVNSLPAHYICPKCKHSEFVEDGAGISGCDLPDKKCPVCGADYKKDGHDIPFETFLGFNGDKEPDIDLNFSGDYQPTIHKYTEEFFGEGYVFRAGTIGTVAEKTAYGYVQKYEEEKGIKIRGAEKRRLAAGCVGVKRTSGQHPGGIIVVPHKNNIHEFCPVQHPADDPNSDIITTHFDYHSIDQNLLKLDELGHDDPTVIRMLADLTDIDPQSIPLDDKETMSLFLNTNALKLHDDIGSSVGTYGVPEFGTKFVRQMLTDTKPTTFSELVRISGLSHGTDVWLGNAQELIRQNITTLSGSICTRDDIMIYLIHMGVEPGHAFKIMESVRKGKGLTEEYETEMRAANVPDWYIDSCKKIKYMFPKAHAVAYVTMAFRIAYCKVHYPEAFYIAYFSVRADDFDASLMAQGMDTAKAALAEIMDKKNKKIVSPKEENLIPILEICIEMYARGISFCPIDLYKSHAVNFLKCEEGIRPPLNALPGMGANAAKSIANAREQGEFTTIEDLSRRTSVTKSIIELLKRYHCLDGIPESEQVSFFDMM